MVNGTVDVIKNINSGVSSYFEDSEIEALREYVAENDIYTLIDNFEDVCDELSIDLTDKIYSILDGMYIYPEDAWQVIVSTKSFSGWDDFLEDIPSSIYDVAYWAAIDYYYTMGGWSSFANNYLEKMLSE